MGISTWTDWNLQFDAGDWWSLAQEESEYWSKY